VGHALEALGGKTPLRHGEAVAIGMVVAARLSLLRRSISEDVLERLINLLDHVGLPTQYPRNMRVKSIKHKIAFDKKHRYQQQRFVLLQGLGSAYVAEDVSDEALTDVLMRSASVIQPVGIR
jgi:3-dehydroquinate synthase